MTRKKSIAYCTNKITASSSSNDLEDCKSLGVDQEQAHEI
jgi:hypothetical protein